MRWTMDNAAGAHALLIFFFFFLLLLLLLDMSKIMKNVTPYS